MVKNLVDAVAKGGSFQVGVGPDAHGNFHPAAVQQLRETGQWLKVNGEGIYNTRARDGAALWKEGDDIRFSRTKDRRYIYAFSLKWPGDTIALKSVKAKPGSTITMLGTTQPLAWRNDENRGLVIQVPSTRPCKYVFGFRIEATDH